MRNGFLWGLGGLAVLAVGCGPDQLTPLTSNGSGDPTQVSMSAAVTDTNGLTTGLTQWMTVVGPSNSTGTGTANQISIKTWVVNTSDNPPAPITVTLRTCALLPGDFLSADSIQFVAPDQAGCETNNTQTVTLAPGASSSPLQDTYSVNVTAGLHLVALRYVLGPEPFWMNFSFGSQ
ncbi:MAG TPA: hypothetical protein VMH39_13080 [Gemmatimonadaceae bacterium]|nr:hypothetical protein [Gemmatimonadaceae bacterium]